MTINDRVYGLIEINAPVLVELIESAPLQRLLGISQLGLPERYFHKATFSRFEHCLGTMLLLRRLGASEEEQVAGLLHDVSHTAFSHVIDWVVGDGQTEDYADLNHRDFLARTVVPTILARYGLDLNRVADCHQFGLLEREAPDLCADRVDYTLRELANDGALKQISDLHLEDFIMHDGQIVMRDLPSALAFARAYLGLQITNWGNFESTNRYRLIAKALKRAIQIGLLEFADLWRDDEYCLIRLEKSSDAEILKILSRLAVRTLKAEELTGDRVNKKFRYIDPLYLDGGRLVRLSESDGDFRAELELARKDNSAGTEMVRI